VIEILYLQIQIHGAHNVDVSNSFDILGGIPSEDSVFPRSVRSLYLTFDHTLYVTMQPMYCMQSVYILQSTNRWPQELEKLNNGDLVPGIRKISSLKITFFNTNCVKDKQAEIAVIFDAINPDVMISESKFVHLSPHLFHLDYYIL
jgi:hypothetical protein